MSRDRAADGTLDRRGRCAIATCPILRSKALHLHYWTSQHGNFGDDLNVWLWPSLLPGMWDPSDGIVFVGIGTILTEAIPPGRRRIVLGSGVGYGVLPRDFGAPGWRVYGVRGPLSAR